MTPTPQPGALRCTTSRCISFLVCNKQQGRGEFPGLCKGHHTILCSAETPSPISSRRVGQRPEAVGWGWDGRSQAGSLTLWYTQGLEQLLECNEHSTGIWQINEIVTNLPVAALPCSRLLVDNCPAPERATVMCTWPVSAGKGQPGKASHLERQPG